MPRRRPNRFPRRVRRLLQLALARARRHSRHQPRPMVEEIVETAAHLQVQVERRPNGRQALAIIQEIVRDLESYEPPSREAHLDPSPEASSVAHEYLESPPDSPHPSFRHHDPPQDNECPVCFERKNDVLLNCVGRHAFCGQGPSRIYQHDAKCPLCRDSFDEATPLFGTPILNILPLENRCTDG